MEPVLFYSVIVGSIIASIVIYSLVRKKSYNDKSNDEPSKINRTIKKKNVTKYYSIQKDTTEISVEDSKKILEDAHKTIENVKNLVEEYKIQTESEYTIPIVNYRLDELKKLNQTFETAEEPLILESCKSNMIVHVEWFVKEEKKYSNEPPWQMVGGAVNMIEKIKIRYNERLYMVVKESFDNYMSKLERLSEHDKELEIEGMLSMIQLFRGHIDTTAKNYKKCYDSLNEFYNQVENTDKESTKTRNWYNLINKTAELNTKGIEFEKEGKIDEAINVYEENIKLQYPASHAYNRLMVLYRKKKEPQNEIRVIKFAIELFAKENERTGNGKYDADIYKYKKRLEKLEGNVSIEISYPQKSELYKIDGVPLGIQYEQTIKLLPEFDFYCNLSEGQTTSDYLWGHRNLVNDEKYKPEIWKIQRKINELSTTAKQYEDIGKLDESAKIYERLVAEKDYHTLPYDRLIKIYSRAKLKEDEKRILELSISHFTELRERQKKYVLYLADKYGKSDFAIERIGNNQKISYYGGAFELYNPYQIIDKWKERLIKIDLNKL
jgi:tetratricopeptide (TPR) repeat protein